MSAGGATGGIVAGVGGSAVAPFSQAPLRNSLDWIGHCASRGGAVDEGVDFEQHPIGDLVGDFYLCSHGVSMTAQAMTWVRAGSGAETGAVNDVVSPGEGELPPSRYLLNGEPGAWSLTITFRRPVSGAGLMTADLYNPSGLNGMTLRAYGGAAATGSMLAETTSPALCFQHNRRYFIGISDDSARIRSIVLSCPNVHLDTVFLEYLAFSNAQTPSALDGDINGDAAIDDADMGVLLAAWGDPECVAADLDESGLVDGADLGILLSQITAAMQQESTASATEAQAAAAEANLTNASQGVVVSTGATASTTNASTSSAVAQSALVSSAQAADPAFHATSSAASPILTDDGGTDAVSSAKVPARRSTLHRASTASIGWTVADWLQGDAMRRRLTARTDTPLDEAAVLPEGRSTRR